MAYKLVTSFQRYIAASTDAKPTGVQPGATLWVYDTDVHYITYDGTNWAVDYLSCLPFTYDIAAGNVPGYEVWSKLGVHAAINTSELDMMPWASGAAGYGWRYPWPTTALTMTLVSDSVEDDPVKADSNPGSGAWTVTLYYLTTAFAEKSVTVALNGTAAVAVADDIYRVQNMRVATCGTAGAAVGNIRLATAVPQTYGYISATMTRQRQCIWTVPAGKTLYVTEFSASCAQQSASKYVRFTTRANYDERSKTILQRKLFMPFNEVAVNNTSFTREMNPPTKIPATTDLMVSAIADSAAYGTCTLKGWLQ